ncbi:hypothetical protein GNE96_19700 [Klebsiella pneumoniae]|nr:hypothetical protein [Klebsiella pneumoniae]
MNWQLISFFGDSTVLLPSAAALFIVLMLRKTSRLLAWQWSLLFGITGAIIFSNRRAGAINWQIFGNKTPNCDRNPVNLTPQK